MKRLLLVALIMTTGAVLSAPSHKVRPMAPLVKKLVIVPAQAGSVTLTSVPAAGGTTLSWSTTATADGIPASSCVASGGWTGSQPATGSSTVPPVTATTVYTLTCTWNDTTTTLAWTNPTTENTGAPFTDQSGVNVYAGTSATGLAKVAALTGTPTTTTLTGQPAGTNYYAVSAVGKAEGEGGQSNVAAKVNGPATASASTTVTVQALPSPPTNVTAT